MTPLSAPVSLLVGRRTKRRDGLATALPQASRVFSICHADVSTDHRPILRDTVGASSDEDDDEGREGLEREEGRRQLEEVRETAQYYEQSCAKSRLVSHRAQAPILPQATRTRPHSEKHHPNHTASSRSLKPRRNILFTLPLPAKIFPSKLASQQRPSGRNT